IYRAWDTPNGYCNYGSGSQSCRILNYEEGELLIESEAITYTRVGYETTVTTNYRIVGGQWLVQITPVSQASQQGMHGETRIFMAPEVGAGGNDWVADSTKYPDGYTAWAPTTSKTTLDLAMDIDTIYVMTWPTPSKARPNANCAHGGWWSGWQLIGEGSEPPVWTAPFAWFGDEIEPVYIGVMPHGFWKYQKIDQTVTAGQVVTGNWVRVYSRTITGSPWTPGGPWVPMYPGKWRLTGCINGQYYTQEVTVTEEDTSSTAFSFTAPVAGTLEYLTFYLYERTDQTPLNVYTVMDIYRGAVQPVAEPVGRHVFYNNSSFDENNPAANADDDDAIAINKTALLPGQTSAFANYTSYNRGINGIMVDIPNLPTMPEITASDF
ncbi:MAG: hypothetical protein KAV00_16685, partial [Phycisphaerae bacterium]|nr:hypothetical protein [Phycisphaerae bacterium]